MNSKNFHTAIQYLKKATGLDENISIEDFKIIWNEIESLPTHKKEVKNEWISIINKYYRKTYGSAPKFYFQKGLDLTQLSLYLKSIKEVIANGK